MVVYALVTVGETGHAEEAAACDVEEEEQQQQQRKREKRPSWLTILTN